MTSISTHSTLRTSRHWRAITWHVASAGWQARVAGPSTRLRTSPKRESFWPTPKFTSWDRSKISRLLREQFAIWSWEVLLLRFMEPSDRWRQDHQNGFNQISIGFILLFFLFKNRLFWKIYWKPTNQSCYLDSYSSVKLSTLTSVEIYGVFKGLLIIQRTERYFDFSNWHQSEKV